MVFNNLHKSFTVQVSGLFTGVLVALAAKHDLAMQLLQTHFSLSSTDASATLVVITALLGGVGVGGVAKGRLDADIKPPLYRR